MTTAEPIALVGAACRFPGAPDIDRFWHLLVHARDAVTDVPRARWDADALYSPDPVAPGKINTRRAALLERIDTFDAGFFHISPREAVQMDPQQRLALELAWEALEDAGISISDQRGSPTGVFLGAFPSDYARLMGNRPERIRQHTATGHDTSSIATRISFNFDFRGPSMVVNTACSSSLVAVHLACQSLLAGECSLALAGGVHVIVTPFSSVLMAKFGALSPDGLSRAFDAEANGYVRGEGGGVVVLKPLSAALAAGDPIYCVIRGSAVNNGGAGPGLTVPNRSAQEQAIRAACHSAGIHTNQVQYVEAHGTGTAVGDPIEAHALAAAFRGSNATDKPLRIGSVKTNIGHLEAASGVAGLLKVALALKHETLPASLHFRTPNPRIDFGGLHLEVQQEATPWPDGNRERIAGVNSIGYGGTNCHVLVAAAPRSERPEAPPRPGSWLLPISAHSPEALSARAGDLSAFLRAAPADLRLDDVCYTAGAGREHLDHRAAALASSPTEMAALLDSIARGESAPDTWVGRRNGAAAPIVFVFPGQGSQWPGMAHRLFEDEPAFREAARQCDAAMRLYLDWSILDTFTRGQRANIPDSIDYVQPAIFTVQVALAELWRSWGVVPDAVIGHSMGEVAAAYVAGILTLEDAALVICKRSRSLRRLSGQGAMASVGLSADVTASTIEKWDKRLSVAISNSPHASVISGEPDAVDSVLRELAAAGVTAHRIQVDVASHSQAMDALTPEIVRELQMLRPRQGHIPFYSTVAATVVDGAGLTATYWAENLRCPVRFAETIEHLAADGYSTFVELSPHPSLLHSVAECLENAETPPVLLPSLRREPGDQSTILQSLGTMYTKGFALNWRAAFPEPRRQVHLPTYPWQRERFWLDPADIETDSDASPSSHPLLGRKLSSPLKVSQYESLLRADRPEFLADHTVLGSNPLPISAYIEMACAAAGQFPLEISDLIIRQPLTVSAGSSRHVQSVVCEREDGTHQFETFSQSPTNAENWTPHASAVLRLCALSDSKHVAEADLLNARARCAEQLSVDAVYADLEDLGLQYGPSFRGLRQIWRGRGEALGCIQLPSSLEADENYSVHPVVLDACLQVGVVAASEATEHATFVPVGIQRASVAGPLKGTGAVWAHAAVRDVTSASGTLDVRVFDANGKVLVQLAGLQARRLEPDTVPDDRNVDEWLYAPVWEPLPPHNSADLLEQRKNWLVLADASGAAAELERAVRAGGGRCVMVTPGDRYAQLQSDHYIVDPLRRDHFDRLVSKVGLQRDWQIAYMWPLDARSTTARPLEQQDRVCGGLLHLAQALIDHEAASVGGIVVVTRGGIATRRFDPAVEPAQSTVWGLARVLDSEHPELATQCLDLDSGSTLVEALRGGALADGEPQVALRDNARRIPTLVRAAPVRSEVDASQSTAVTLESTGRGALDNLVRVPVERTAPGPNEVEIRVEATGLNFRDVLEALGLNAWGSDPFGNECAGTVVRVGGHVNELRVGDEVLALASNSFSTYVVAPAELVLRRPPGLTSVDAATLPVAFLTAAYALKCVGRLKAGQRVLIHSAAGGVGMAAVQLAMQAGAEVIATASPSKWGALRALGVRCVANSRTLEFVDRVREVTQGEGVDLVLNSLGSEFIPASLGLLRPGGRFVELGKRDEWNEAEVRRRGLGIEYTRLDLGEIARTQPRLLRSLLSEVLRDLEGGSIRPLPRGVFPPDRVADAFETMAHARHVGKIVVARPEENVPVRQSGTYLITGGLGALGLHVARWLVEHGARHLLLVGRQPISLAPDGARELIRQFERAGAYVTTVAGDVADAQALARVLEDARSSCPPIVGVFHAAGVLDDAVLVHQDWQRFQSVLAPKVEGAWLLHEMTRHLALDWFVLFSSMASALGSAGQSNYAAANAYLDALAHYRRARGLPALSVNWGAWGGGGMVTPVRQRLERHWTAQGVKYMSPEVAVELLGDLIQAGWRNPPQLGAVAIDWTKYLEHSRGPGTKRMCAKLASSPSVRHDRVTPPDPRPPTATAIRAGEELRRLSATERRQRVRAYVMQEVASVLGFEPSHVVDGQTRFAELGLDSLMAVELHGRLRARLNVPIPLTTMFDAPTVEGVANVVAELLTPAGELSTTRPPLFCIAPVLGAAAVYVHLARELGVDQPLYGLQPPGVDGREPPLTSVEGMAARYVQSIRQIQARGPYYLAGWSFGGIVAYELARQLAERGDEVALLAVIDTASPTNKRSIWSSLQFFATVGVPGLRFFLPDYVAMRFGKWDSTRRTEAARFLAGDWSPNALNPSLRAISNVFAASVWAGYHYEPREFAGRLTLLRTTMPHHQLESDRSWGWTRLAQGGVAVHTVPGRHMDVLRPPHVRSLATALRTSIELPSSGDVQQLAHSP